MAAINVKYKNLLDTEDNQTRYGSHNGGLQVNEAGEDKWTGTNEQI